MSDSAEVAAAREAARVLVEEHNLGDFVYNVRERELKGWNGPKVMSFANAVATLRAFAKGETATTYCALCGAGGGEHYPGCQSRTLDHFAAGSKS